MSEEARSQDLADQLQPCGHSLTMLYGTPGAPGGAHCALCELKALQIAVNLLGVVQVEEEGGKVWKNELASSVGRDLKAAQERIGELEEQYRLEFKSAEGYIKARDANAERASEYRQRAESAEHTNERLRDVAEKSLAYFESMLKLRPDDNIAWTHANQLRAALSDSASPAKEKP